MTYRLVPSSTYIIIKAQLITQNGTLRTKEKILKVTSFEETDDEIDITTESTVTQAMSKLQWVCDVEVEPTRSDIEEKELVKEFLGSGCGCHLSDQKCCSLKFSAPHIEEVRSHPTAPIASWIIMVLLGQIMAASNSNDTIDTVVVASGHVKITRIKGHQGLLVGYNVSVPSWCGLEEPGQGLSDVSGTSTTRFVRSALQNHKT